MEHSELYTKSRPVIEPRIRTEAYRIFYTVNRQLEEGFIFKLTEAEWMDLASVLIDPNKVGGECEIACLKEFLRAMPFLVRHGGIPVNWSKKGNGSQKYSVDEWGMVTRIKNPPVNVQDPRKPKPYRSPVRREPDAPRFRPEGSKAELKEELSEATRFKQVRHATVLPIKNSTRAENGPQNIHLRHEPKQITVLPVNATVKPVTMLALGDGASVDTYDWGIIVGVSGDRYTVEFAEHSTIDPDTLDTIRRGGILARVGFEEVIPV